MIAIEDSVDAGLIARILGEYREMPGLALTMDQARRFWGCDAPSSIDSSGGHHADHR